MDGCFSPRAARRRGVVRWRGGVEGWGGGVGWVSGQVLT